MNILGKILIGEATIDDQDEALKNPISAFYFAFKVKGADIEKCQEAACKDSGYAYMFAVHIKESDFAKIQQLCPEISGKINELIMNRVLV